MAGNNIGDMVVSIVGDNSQFNKTLDETKQKLDSSKTSFSKLKDGLLELDNSLGGVGQKMIALAKNPIVLLTTAIIGTTKFLVDSTKELVAYGDEMNDLSEQTGLSTKALQEYKFVAEQTGGSLGTITNSIKLMTRGLETNKDTFKELGIQIKDSNGQFLSSEQIFDNTVGALGGLTNETEKSNLALKLFGRGALEMVPLLKLGSAGVQELKEKANNLGLVLSETTIKQADKFKDSTTALAETWKTFSMNLTSSILPILNGLNNKLIETFTIMSSWKEAQKNVDIVDNYKKGKDSVIVYHDALKGLIDFNQKIINSDTATAKNKQIAMAEVQKDYRRLNDIMHDYGIAISEANKKEADQAALNLKIEKEKESSALQQEITDARNKATTDYDAALKLINLEVKEGIKTELEAKDEKQKASEALLKALNDIIIKYNLLDGATVNLANDTVKSLNDMKDTTDSWASNYQAQADAFLFKMVKVNDDTKKQSKETKAQLIKDTEEEKNKKIQAYLKTASTIVDVTQTMVNDIGNLINGSTEDMGKAFAKLAADIASQFGPQGQIIATIITVVSSIIEIFTESERRAEENKRKLLQKQQEYAKSVLEIQKNMLDQQIKNEQTLLKNKTDALDKEKNAALIAAGLTEDTRQQDLKDSIKDIDEQLKIETDAEKIKQLKKQKIIAEFEIKKQNAIDESNKKQVQLAYQAALLQQKIAIAQAKIDKVKAAQSAAATVPSNPNNPVKYTQDVLAAVNSSNALYDELIGLLSTTIPVPAAEGAIVTPTPGGTIMQVGEGNKTEVIFPLDKLENFINKGTMTGSSSGDIHLIVQMDSKPFLDTIFPATKNKTVLISANSVV